MSTVLLIRHCESRSNAGLPTLRPEDVTLTNLGIEQAKYIAQYFAYQVPLDLIVTSSYKRTKQTAVPTMLRFLSVRKEEWPVHEFTYLSREEIRALSTRRQRRPLVDVYWELCDPRLVDGPGSESFEQFIERVRGVMGRLEKMHEDQTIAVFSHEQFICAVYWLLECKPERISSEAMREFKDFLTEHTIPNGGFLHLQRPDAHYSWQCELMVPLVAATV